MRKLVIRAAVEAVLIAAIAVAAVITVRGAGLAETDGEILPLYVTVELLNGREHPTKKSPVGAVYGYGDELAPTGKISRDGEWVEVYGGEAGTVWVKACYVSERFLPFTVTNENNGKIRVRSSIGCGKLKGYIRNGKSVEIDRVVLGWGHCKQGWVDLDYLIEEVEHN